MVLALKIILGIFAIASIVFGRLVFREYKQFNKDIETKSTSLAERILINGIALVLIVVLLGILSFSIIMMFSNITVQLPF